MTVSALARVSARPSGGVGVQSVARVEEWIVVPSIHDRSSGALPLRTSHWFAWVDRMPPAPGSLHVTGAVAMPSPGFDVRLAVASSQGVEPTELVLELRITDRPGSWPAAVTPMTVRYDVDPYDGAHETVRVLLPSGQELTLKLDQTF